ncbi:MAG: reverse gyrase [Candidatus Micrarchaeia archaeon]
MKNMCPNCGGDISSERLLMVGVCESCLPEEVTGKINVIKLLEERGNLNGYKEFAKLHKDLANFSNIFLEATKRPMWNMQEVWAKRFLKNESFSIIAPTGSGKTVFGCVACIFEALKGNKAYFIVPTSLLAEQVYQKMKKFTKNIFPEDIGIVSYYSGMKDRDKKTSLERIKEGNFNILITTNRFFSSNFNLLSNFVFSLIFIDDIDSFLKTSKNVDLVLRLIGFEEEFIESALKVIGSKKEESLEGREKFKEAVFKIRNSGKIGKLIVSGATIRAKRTKRTKLFNILLGFEESYVPTFVRNVEDLFVQPTEAVEEIALKLIKKLGSGGLIFVPSEKGIHYAFQLHKKLVENGVRSFLFDKMRPGILDKFGSGEYDVLVGIVSSRSPLARGIDLPETVRYALFVGVPRIEILLSTNTFNPRHLITILKNIRDLIESEDLKQKADYYISHLKKFITITHDQIELLSRYRGSEVKDNPNNNGFLKFAFNSILEAQKFLESLMKTENIVEKIKSSKELALKEKDGLLYLIVSDPEGYIQASGRTSRLYIGGVSKGIAITIVDDEKAWNSMNKRIKWYVEEITWKNLDEINLELLVKKVDEDREKIRAINEGKIASEVSKEFIKSALFIVESPNKARTIAKMFGKPAKRIVGDLTFYETATAKYVLTIVATGGHIFDLITHELTGFHGIVIKGDEYTAIYGPLNKCAKCNTQFVSSSDKCPVCGSTNIISKKSVIDAIRQIATEANLILIGTDPDIEGEKIAWDLKTVVSPFNDSVYRVRFHEVTRRGIVESLLNTEDVNLNLVKAQLVRRIEDRWIGFELSKRLWAHFNNQSLSAGRVQTPVLGWVINRWQDYKKKRYMFKIFLPNNVSFSIVKEKGAIKNMKDYLNNLHDYWSVEDLGIYEETLSPFPPYTTSDLIRDASKFLGFSAEKAMTMAQQLFELGLITYHRTDSTRVSSYGISIAKELIEGLYSLNVFQARSWEITAPGIQAAHECIRPTRAIDDKTLQNLVRTGIYHFPMKLTNDHFRLYQLILKRFIASQMKNAIIQKQKIRVINNAVNEKIELSINTKVQEPGYTLVTGVHVVQPISAGLFKPIKVEKYLVPSASLFTQGEIVEEMRKNRIGRPSTYSKIVNTLLKEGYIRDYNGKLIPTKRGISVFSFLKESYGSFVSEELTKKLEETLDKIMSGEVNYIEVVNSLYSEIRALPP